MWVAGLWHQKHIFIGWFRQSFVDVGQEFGSGDAVHGSGETGDEVLVEDSGFALPGFWSEVILLGWPVLGFNEGFKVVCRSRLRFQTEFLF
jgi:hypothetical protein